MFLKPLISKPHQKLFFKEKLNSKDGLVQYEFFNAHRIPKTF